MRFVYVASAEPEWIALFTLTILLAFSLSDRGYANARTRMFRACCLGTILSIASNIVTIMCWPQAAELSRAFVNRVNVLYFIITPLAEVLVAMYVVLEIYASSPGQRSMWISLMLLGATYAMFIPLIISNDRTGLLFVLDGQNGYARGSASWANILLVSADIIVVLVTYLLRRKQTEASFRSVMLALPPLAFAMSVFQQVSPQTQLSGTTMSMVLLILFINCQRQRVTSDPLTGVGSRESLFDAVGRMIQSNRPFVLQLVSLRNFKRINQRFGLTTGDAFLRKVAQTLKHIYPEDACYRIGGADFVIIHDHASGAESHAQVTRLQALFEDEWRVGEQATHLGASFAEAAYPQGGASTEELINGLEFCLLQAREKAMGSLVTFNEDIRQNMLQRERLTELIQLGMEQDRFFLCYQPIFESGSRRVCACEALLRLRDGDGATVSPGMFIPLAEESGAIVPLTWIVVDKVCAFLARNGGSDLPPVSVNFSAQQFMEPDMLDRLREILKRHGVSPGEIKVEITERMMTQDDALLSQNILRLIDMGVGLYLDDFGTGYSNLASAARLPFEVVKVDKSLLSATSQDKPDVLLQAVFSGLTNMGVKVLMEGVETPEQVERVCELGADRLQGFFFARPMEEQAFIGFLHTEAAAGA